MELGIGVSGVSLGEDGWRGNASVNSSCAHPPLPPGNNGAFSHTVNPGGRALAFYTIPPGHLTISLFSPYSIVAFLMANSSANTVSFLLNASR